MDNKWKGGHILTKERSYNVTEQKHRLEVNKGYTTGKVM